MNSFGDAPRAGAVQPVGRNWKLYGITAVAVLLLATGFVVWSLSGAKEESDKTDWKAPGVSYSEPAMPKRTFETEKKAEQTAQATAPQPPPPPTASLLATPVSITARQSSILSWSSTNATSCTGTGFSASGISGATAVSPPVSATYSLTCTGASGSASANATVTVSAVSASETSPRKDLISSFQTTADDEAIGYFAQVDKSRAPPARQNGEYRPGMTDGIDKLDPDQHQALVAYKTNWLANAGTGGDDYVTQPLMPPVCPHFIQASAMIQATTINGVKTDLPGDIAARINDDWYDHVTGQYILIPKTTSIIYGRYNPQLSYGQRVIQAAWNRIHFEDGSIQPLGAMAATDSTGVTGIEGYTDRHLGALSAAVAISTISTLVGQAGELLSGGSGDTNIGILGAGTAGREAGNVGQQMASRELNRPNTNYLPPNWPVAVMLTKDLCLPPFRPHARTANQ